MTNNKFTNFPLCYYSKELIVTSYFPDLLFQLEISGTGSVLVVATPLNVKLFVTIKHSSRMHTACLETESASSFSDHQSDFTLKQGVDPEMNKSEQVSSDDATRYH